MSRLAGLARFLALTTLLGALVCTYLAARPADLDAWWLVARLGLWPGLADGTTLVALGVFVVCGWLARRLDRRRLVLPDPRRKIHRVGGGKGGPEDTKDRPSPRLPVAEIATGRTDAAERRRRRPRIEARLSGRHADVPGFLDELFRLAVDSGASDLHLQPLERSTRVSLRIGGELEEVATAPRSAHESLVRRLLVLASLPSYTGETAQDGRFALETPRGMVDVRLSVVPTHHGAKAVLRLARLDPGLFELDRLGLPASLLADLSRLLAEPQGVVVLSGPTGSGKTTTLYAALTHIHATRGQTTNLATLEDPVEVELPFLSQTPVRQFAAAGPSATGDRVATPPGRTFAQALRSVLRQDPDVLMVGEIRDSESAATAIQAGLSGHLILTTVHADSAAGVFPRLFDLGVEPFLAASAVMASLAQRLARRLCPDCRHPARLARPLLEQAERRGVETAGRTFYTAEGCRACGGNGHRGRHAIFELLRLDPALRRAVTERLDPRRLSQQARAAGMASPPLLEQAVQLAVAGEISLEEAFRVTAA